MHRILMRSKCEDMRIVLFYRKCYMTQESYNIMHTSWYFYSFVPYVTTNTEESSAWRSRATYFLDLTTFASNGSRRYSTSRLLEAAAAVVVVGVVVVVVVAAMVMVAAAAAAAAASYANILSSVSENTMDETRDIFFNDLCERHRRYIYVKSFLFRLEKICPSIQMITLNKMNRGFAVFLDFRSQKYGIL
ncbi:hypothetical protein V1478_007048 [Vespula squamosa]|uniref:Uncharacterized protein n=1 Tax=Vespula squamosa TaxID=30214 RepID=A0ABD2B223_VESSQ